MNAPLSLSRLAPLKERPYPLPVLPPNRCYLEESDPATAGRIAFTEDSDLFDSYTYQLERIVYSGQTAVQRVLIADTYNYGRALMLDGAIQSAQDDEALYHELLVQPAMLAHPNPRDVLIIGGGEGATLREVLVHASVRSATMIDIDEELVELCREHLVSWHRGAFNDPRVRLLSQDGRKFVEQDDRSYDVVIIDVIDMLEGGPAQAMYTRQFYELLRGRLRPGGLVVVQGLEFSFLDDRSHAALARTLRTVFPEVHSYHAAIPSFLGTWGFLIASDWWRPSDWRAEDIDRGIEQRLGAEWLQHVTGDFLKACFTLCKETRFLLSLPGPILEDGVTFVQPPFIDDVETPFAEFPIRKPGAR
ncbi:MAG TPA: fused MFS/spermidine synthase [Burkholderiaceae bacterium]|nr:fused MFS/spermidine synthase [Burkholderiaceae bacterium]HQR71865.1 fused MFS/spermidine synthase [Burkholderiaceae bacterium]